MDHATIAGKLRLRQRLASTVPPTRKPMENGIWANANIMPILHGSTCQQDNHGTRGIHGITFAVGPGKEAGYSSGFIRDDMGLVHGTHPFDLLEFAGV